MREVIDYSKDFLSGETIERKRNKDDVNYRGIATIQLFDEKGNIVQEIKSENMINSKWLSYLYKSFFSACLIYNKYPLFYGNKSVAQYIVLTNNTESEESNEFVKGNLIGFASGWVPYSGDDIERGTLNAAETYATDFRKHFVIDFPTHAANGTFQSIYWMPGLESTERDPSFCTFKEDKMLCYFEKDNPVYRFIICGDYIYGYTDNSKPSAFNKVDIKTSKIVRSVENTDLTNSYVGVGLGDGKIYFFTTKYANVYDTNLNFIKKINYNPLEATNNVNVSYVTSYEDGFVIASGSKYYLYDFELNEIRFLNGLTNFFNGSMGRVVYIGNGIFNYGFLESRYNNDPEYGTMKYYDINKDEEFVWRKDRNYLNYLIKKDEREIYYQYSYIFNPFYDWKSKKMYYTDYHTSRGARIFECTRVPWFAHTLLPAPVTKTATNTMKIQYDFVVEERGYFD